MYVGKNKCLYNEKDTQGWKYLMTCNNNNMRNPLPTSYGVSHVITVECIIPAVPHKCFLVSLHHSKFYVKKLFTLVHVLFPVDLHPDVNLKRTGIEIDDNNNSQCRVQFIVSVSDSIHMYIDMYLFNQCTFIGECSEPF